MTVIEKLKQLRTLMNERNMDVYERVISRR